MEDAHIYKSSFNRTNLFYEVRQKKHAKKQLIQYLNEHKGKSGVIYCLSRKKVEEIAELLNVNGFNAAPYHAGLDPAIRERNQDNFLNENVDIIVATIAFGMGIDKPDVRFVIHYDVPKSLEGYYQETGRAGRDGLEGRCLMFYSHNDINKLEKFNKDKSVQERENARLLLQEMSFYAESPICRRKQLLHYFGEEYKVENCGGCDNCLHPKEQFEGKEFVKTAIEAAQQTNERFGLNHLVHVIRGVKSDYVNSYQHNKLAVFGAGDSEDEDLWKSVIRQALIHEYLAKDIENIGVLKVTHKGRAFVKSPNSVMLSKDHEYESTNEEEEGSDKPPVNAKAYDETLFGMLKALRKKVAHEKDIPPYVIFQDPSLEEMATTYPTTAQELGQINGVGQGKVQKFGNVFLALINEYVDEHDIIPASDVVVKSSVNKSKMKIFIIQQVDRKIDLDEIAETKSIPFSALLTEIENIIYSGTKLNLDYYIDEVMDDDKQDDLYDYFLNAETDSISEALSDEDNADYSEEEIRLMRIKFMSEYAN